MMNDHRGVFRERQFDGAHSWRRGHAREPEEHAGDLSTPAENASDRADGLWKMAEMHPFIHQP
jgi:hypothetical protein